MFRRIVHQERVDVVNFKNVGINTSCDILAKQDILIGRENIKF